MTDLKYKLQIGYLKDEEQKWMQIKTVAVALLTFYHFTLGKYLNDFAIDNNLDTLNYNHFKNEITVNNFFNNFEFFERSDFASNESYLKNTTGINIDESNSIKFETRRNKVTNFTEYYNLIYEYNNDCLRASLEYNKNYYSDRDLKPEDKLLFKIAIIPFASSYSSKISSE